VRIEVCLNVRCWTELFEILRSQRWDFRTSTRHRHGFIGKVITGFCGSTTSTVAYASHAVPSEDSVVSCLLCKSIVVAGRDRRDN
jgi:hypothetical protein